MQEIAAAQLAGLELVPSITIDAEISLDEVDWALYETLAQLEPTGQENRTPIFLSRNVEVMSHRVVGQEGAHLQMRLSSSNGSEVHKLLPAIAFRQGAWADGLPQLIDVVYSINLNEWNGRRNLQLMVQDLRPS